MTPKSVEQFSETVMRQTRDPTPSRNRPSLASRLLWFAALWLAGVGTVAAAAYSIRLFIM
jgi:hypothetical protein